MPSPSCHGGLAEQRARTKDGNTTSDQRATGQGWPPGPQVWVGTNFWSRAGGPQMWSRYDGDVVKEELEALAALGCTLTRSFCYWPDFMPEPETLDEEVMERFTDFLELHRQAGLWTVPTFIVGHMSGENWDPAWRGGRDLYRDVWLVSQQAWFVAEIARRTSSHPAIAAWLLSNEMPLYGRNGDEAAVTAWVRLLVHALRAGGATQPVGTGDGAWGIEVTGNDNGFSLRRIAPMVEFIGPHVYPSSDDPVRQMLAAAFACELCSAFGKPVVLEEFGLSSDMASGENAAHYYRQVLHSSLLAGAQGWLAWNNCDFDNLASQDPYRHHPFEMHFGITDHAGQPKPQAHELARFSGLVTQLSTAGWHRPRGEVALLVPEHFEHTEPSWSAVYRGDMRSNLFQSYIAAREADLPVDLVRERDLLQIGGDLQSDGDDAPALQTKLYLMPCAKFITAPGLQLMLARAREGATVYASYFAGTGREQPGPWAPWLDQVFGVAHHLRYGVANMIEAREVTMLLLADVGDLLSGTRLEFPVAGEGVGRSYMPVEPTDAEVLAIDNEGRPALLRNRVGDGWMVFCTYPLEYMAACRPSANPEPTWQLYSALAGLAGVARPVRADDPRIIIGALKVGERDAYLALNVSPGTVDANLVAPERSISLASSPSGEKLDALHLNPYEVELLYAE